MISYEALRRRDLCWWGDPVCQLNGVPIEVVLEEDEAAKIVRLCPIHARDVFLRLEAGKDVELWHDPAGLPRLLAA